MNICAGILILGLSILSIRGVMAEHSDQPISPDWVKIQDKQRGLQVEFPNHPVEMNIEFPLQNTPATGQLQFLSYPSSNGLLAFSSFFSLTFNTQEIDKERLKTFFETILVPHFFFNPSIFQNHQVYHFHTAEIDGKEAASFQFSFKDGKVLKRLEGLAIVVNETLYTAFYMASDSDFDQDLYERFLESVQLPQEN